MSLVTASGFFAGQLTQANYLGDVFYGLATVSLLLVVMAIGLVDGGLVRRKNLLHTWIQKLFASLLAGGSFLIIGYAIWNWQYNQAFGIPNPLGQAFKDWWLFGTNMTHFSQQLDPKVVPQADVFQIFAVFFVAYAAVVGALLHSAGLERIKTAPLYILSAIGGGLLMPILAYLTWGSVSPLTNHGVHDYMGIYSLYIFVGVWALILAWRLGPRIGAFAPHSRTHGPFPHNIGMTASGVALLLFAVPFLAVGCGFMEPGQGYFGIAMTTSGLGLTFINVAAAFVGGAIGGALISAYTRNPVFILLGPVAGYVGAGACMDVIKPWEAIIIAFFSPFFFWAVYELMGRLRIDEKKMVPLGLGCGIYSAVVAGFFAWHTKTGGYFGLTGKYGFQHAQITPWWQILGVVVVVAISAVSGLVLVFALEKTVGLRVTEDQELEGLDSAFWQAPPPTSLDAPAEYGDALRGGEAVTPEVVPTIAGG